MPEPVTGDQVRQSPVFAALTPEARETVARGAEYQRHRMAPEVGSPATIHLFSDSLAAVVVKVNPKSVVVRRVEVDEASKRRVNHEAEPWPAFAWDGDTSQPYGEPERYSLVGHREDGSPIYRNGSIGLSLGRSVKFTDYRY